MSHLRFHRPSPAMAVALIALFVALGGTGYAALKLPKNSVGARQIKANAVSGSKVKNGSLQAADFARGQLPAGPKGDKGDAGTPGTNGHDGAAAIRYFASLKEDGTIVASSPGATATKLAGFPGIYKVTFPQVVDHCAAVATQGGVPILTSPDSSTPATPGFARADINSGSQTVTVNTKDTSGTDSDTSFYLIVAC